MKLIQYILRKFLWLKIIIETETYLFEQNHGIIFSIVLFENWLVIGDSEWNVIDGSGDFQESFGGFGGLIFEETEDDDVIGIDKLFSSVYGRNVFGRWTGFF